MDFRPEMEARLTETQAIVDHKLIQQKMETNQSFEALRADIKQIDVRMAKTEARLVRWFAGTTLAIIAVNIAIATFIVNALAKTTTPAPEPAPSQPIIVVIPLDR